MPLPSGSYEYLVLLEEENVAALAHLMLEHLRAPGDLEEAVERTAGALCVVLGQVGGSDARWFHRMAVKIKKALKAKLRQSR